MPTVEQVQAWQAVSQEALSVLASVVAAEPVNGRTWLTADVSLVAMAARDTFMAVVDSVAADMRAARVAT